MNSSSFRRLGAMSELSSPFCRRRRRSNDWGGRLIRNGSSSDCLDVTGWTIHV
jgi:hypothetical protein